MNIDALDRIDADAVARFQRDGYLVVPDLLDRHAVEALRDRLPRLYRGEFETGIYPDEWYWRDGITLPDVTGHLSNCWKSDLTIARLVLSEDIARTAGRLFEVDGIRLGLDTVWVKAPGAKAIALHQDNSFLDYLDPPRSITCWVALDDTRADAGTIEYVPGSHRWPLVERPLDFHIPEGGYQAKMRAAAAGAGMPDPEPVKIEVSAGSCVFHDGQIWHGSGSNDTEQRTRRSIGMHMLPADVRFGPNGGGYIFGRYQRIGSTELDESFFPVLWRRDGAPTEFVDAYCAGRPVRATA